MIDDLIKRLRAAVPGHGPFGNSEFTPAPAIQLEAADAIEKLVAERDAARSAIRYLIDEDGCTCERCMMESEHAATIAAARAKGGVDDDPR